PPTHHPPPVAGSPIAHAGSYTLWRVRGAEPLLSFLYLRRIVPSGSEALRHVKQTNFDPGFRVMLQRDPGFPYEPSTRAQLSAIRRHPSGELAVTVTTSRPGI